MNDELTEQQIKELKSELEALRIELETSLNESKSASDPVKLDQQLMGRVSRIDAIQQQNMASANRANQELRLRRINHALKLIEKEDYGFCRQCDEPIGFGRLKIKPEATLCIKCQNEAEH